MCVTVIVKGSWLYWQMMCRNTASCRDRTKCIAELCFGKFLHAIIAGWDDSECQRTFDAICQNTCMLKHITIVINSKPGCAVSLIICTFMIYSSLIVGLRVYKYFYVYAFTIGGSTPWVVFDQWVLALRK